MSKVLITTVPFSTERPGSLDLLNAAGIDYSLNPIGRKLKESELADIIGDYEVLIAGTEPITDAVMQKARRLKLISRVGVGLDSVDLVAAKQRGIHVSYTPDAPAPAVAEMTIGLIFSLLRSIHISNSQMHRGEWQRHFGRRISEVTIGIIGAGRIGSKVLKQLTALGAKTILVNELNQDRFDSLGLKAKFATKEHIYEHCDIISIHVPLTKDTKNMMTSMELLKMKSNALIINTARGGIINEYDLFKVLNTGHLGAAAIDVFDQEPYCGELSKVERCLLTSHMGSMSIDCRNQMEIGATEEAIRFITNQPLQSLVPIEEYNIQLEGL